MQLCISCLIINDFLVQVHSILNNEIWNAVKLETGLGSLLILIIGSAFGFSAEVFDFDGGHPVAKLKARRPFSFELLMKQRLLKPAIETAAVIKSISFHLPRPPYN